MVYIITVDELQQLQKEVDVLLIDVRSNLGDPQIGRSKYEEAHLPGAFFLDMKEDLSGEVGQHGGNHPLPEVDEFAATLGSIGVRPETKVVIYDDSNGMFAARAWWIFHYFGHADSMILEGGYHAWVDAGHGVTSTIPERAPTTFIPKILADEVVTMEEVKERDKQKSVLIDSRSFARYTGENEPMYEKAGHIPGAKNYFWGDVMDEQNGWKNVASLQKHFQTLSEAEEIIVSCGSGISACPNVLALKMAGYTNVKLYPGSFSDWISYEDNDIVTGEE